MKPNKSVQHAITTDFAPTTTISDEIRDTLAKSGMSRIDSELYKEEDDVAMPVIRVKHITLPNKGDRWKILENAQVSLVIEGKKLNKQEREFLRTVEGVNFLIRNYKSGLKSFNSLRRQLKIVVNKGA